MFYEDEKRRLTAFKEDLKTYLNQMERNLKELTGIGNSLYYEIIVNGLNVTKAVDKVSFKYDKEVSTIWKNYYPQVKEKLNDLEKINIIDNEV